MLKCPACGRSGGPFRLRHQLHADSQIIRSWACPCGEHFQARAGSERVGSAQSLYVGFTVEWNENVLSVRLERIDRQEATWSMGSWMIQVSGPPSGPGTRIITLFGPDDEPAGEWRVEPSWGPSEMVRKLKAGGLPAGLEPEVVARVLARTLG